MQRIMRENPYVPDSIGHYGNEKAIAEECGVFAVYGLQEASVYCALGLHALQHRGQESAGIAAYNGKAIEVERNTGLVGEHYNKHDVINKLKGFISVGHVRYSTQGGSRIENAQPLSATFLFGKTILSHNGHIVNATNIRKELSEEHGDMWQTDSDSEVILQLMGHSKERNFFESFKYALSRIIGGYAIIAMCNDTILAARDPNGIRPLVLGKLGDAYILSSESCAFNIIGATFIREIQNGEIVTITKNELKSHFPFARQRARPCLFEYIYFSRPDSILNGKSVYEHRKALGKQLALENSIDNIDVVIPIPDSGIPSAIGYAKEASIEFDLGIVRNHYVGRTFIEPKQRIRELGVRLKHSPNIKQIEGRNVLLIDDSIVRGTTSTKIVSMIRHSGAKSVSLLISSPQIKYPDYYGIDIPCIDNLVSAKQSLENIRKKLCVDYLNFISLDGLYIALTGQKRDAKKPFFSDHCFTGEYPTQIPTDDHDKNQKSLFPQINNE